MQDKRPYLFPGRATLAGNATGQLTFTVESDYTYRLTGFSYRVYSATANDVPYFSFMIRAGSDRLTHDYVPADAFAGMMLETSTAPDTRYPVGLANWFNFDVPYDLRPRTDIIVDLRNDIANQIVVSFIVKGIRVFG